MKSNSQKRYRGQDKNNLKRHADSSFGKLTRPSKPPSDSRQLVAVLNNGKTPCFA